jgi:effector-binding domain-containing protein
MPYDVRLKDLAPQRFVAAHTRCPRADVPATLGRMLEDVWTYLSSLEHVTVGPAIARYHGHDEDEILVEAGFPVAEDVPDAGVIAVTRLPHGPAATALHYGPYEGLHAAHAAVAAWIAAHGRVADGPAWEIFWVDASQAAAPEELRTEVVWPIK